MNWEGVPPQAPHVFMFGRVLHKIDWPDKKRAKYFYWFLAKKARLFFLISRKINKRVFAKTAKAELFTE